MNRLKVHAGRCAMALHEECVTSGQWLFRHRGILPIAGVALLLSQVESVAPKHGPEGVPLLWPLVCFAISIVGLGLRAYTVGCAAPGTSGRNRSAQVADSLNTTGPYSVVRHPLYLANFIGWLGPVLVVQRIWLTVVFGLAFWVYYERIMFAEEEFLRKKYGPTFLEWAARTPTFIPTFRHWVPPHNPFNLWVVLRREYSAMLQLVVVFAVLNWAQWWVSYREWEVEGFWEWALIFGAGIALALRLLRRHSRLLEDPPAQSAV